jgi:hypothetical protein
MIHIRRKVYTIGQLVRMEDWTGDISNSPSKLTYRVGVRVRVGLGLG